ncbi:hypothetical protein AAH476_37715, partial [Enterobacter cloacae subsp. cloacae]
MKWSWPDSPGGAALARAYGLCRPGKRSATRQKERAVSIFLPVRRLAQFGIVRFLENSTAETDCTFH